MNVTWNLRWSRSDTCKTNPSRWSSFGCTCLEGTVPHLEFSLEIQSNHLTYMSVISFPPSRFSPSEAHQIAKTLYGFEVSVKVLDSERDQNFYLKREDGKEFVLKISNPAEDVELIKLQVASLKHIANFDSSIQVPSTIQTVGGEFISRHNGCFIRLQSFLAGHFIKDIENPESFLLEEFGAFLGKLDVAFREFDYPDLKRKWIWDVRNIDFLKSHLDYIESESDKAVVRHFIANYQLNIVPNEKYLRTQYIHNDGNDYNVLLNDNVHISGVIDFGDMAHTFLASELAVAITYLILEEAEPETKIKSVVQGFQSVYPLRDEEIESLIHLVCVRACFSVVTANYRKKLFPENKYISVTEPYAWTFLKNFADKELSNFKIY